MSACRIAAPQTATRHSRSLLTSVITLLSLMILSVVPAFAIPKRDIPGGVPSCVRAPGVEGAYYDICTSTDGTTYLCSRGADAECEELWPPPPPRITVSLSWPDRILVIFAAVLAASLWYFARSRKGAGASTRPT